MKINLTQVFFHPRKKLLLHLMRASIFLLCFSVFSFSTENILSQNTKITINESKKLETV